MCEMRILKSSRVSLELHSTLLTRPGMGKAAIPRAEKKNDPSSGFSETATKDHTSLGIEVTLYQPEGSVGAQGRAPNRGESSF